MAISQKLLNEGESIVISTRTHPKALLLPFFVLLVFLAIGVFVQRALDDNKYDVVVLVVWAVVGIGIVWYSLRPALIWATASYTITNRRLITRSGVLTRKGHDIPLSRISDVAYELGIIDRMLGCGTLVISDASTHGQVALPDIPRVEETQRRLNQLLHEMHDAAPADEGL